MARNVANTRRLTFCIIVIVACITLFSILKLLYPDPSCFDNNNSYNTNSHLSHANLKELAGKVDELNQLDYNMSRYQKSEFIVHDKAYVALCMIARNEHKFIREWIQYHYFIGVQKFYIYDNLSTPPLIGTIMDFVLKGIVDVQYLTTQWKLDEFGLNKVEVKFNNVKQVNSPQRWAHADCLLNHGKNHKFIGMIDVDEFIVLNEGEEHNYSPTPNPDLPTFLRQFEHTGGLWLYWRIFGSSGLVQSPRRGGVLKNYVSCQPRPGTVKDQTHHKQIVNTQHVGKGFCVIHGCETTVLSVDPLMRAKSLQSAKYNATWEKINIHHYMVKSKEDYQNKLLRGGGHSPKSKYQSWRGEEFWENVEKGTDGHCTFMKDFAGKCCAI